MFNRVALRLRRNRSGSVSTSQYHAADRLESAIRSVIEPLETEKGKTEKGISTFMHLRPVSFPQP
jgi:hypothetical protein